MFNILCLENLNDLLSLYNVPVGSVHAETIYRLIAIVVSYIKSPQQCVMIYTSSEGSIPLEQQSAQ